MDSMVQVQRKKDKGEKRGKKPAGKVDGQRKEEEAVQTLWGILYGDDAGIIAITRRIREDDGDRGFVRGVQAYGVGGQDGDHVPATKDARGRCRSPSLQPARYTNTRLSLCTCEGLSARTEISVSR